MYLNEAFNYVEDLRIIESFLYSEITRKGYVTIKDLAAILIMPSNEVEFTKEWATDPPRYIMRSPIDPSIIYYPETFGWSNENELIIKEHHHRCGHHMEHYLEMSEPINVV